MQLFLFVDSKYLLVVRVLLLDTDVSSAQGHVRSNFVSKRIKEDIEISGDAKIWFTSSSISTLQQFWIFWVFSSFFRCFIQFMQKNIICYIFFSLFKLRSIPVSCFLHIAQKHVAKIFYYIPFCREWIIT